MSRILSLMKVEDAYRKKGHRKGNNATSHHTLSLADESKIIEYLIEFYHTPYVYQLIFGLCTGFTVSPTELQKPRLERAQLCTA